MPKDSQWAGYAQMRLIGMACWKYKVFPFAFMYLEELAQIAKESKILSFCLKQKEANKSQAFKGSRLKGERLMKP